MVAKEKKTLLKISELAKSAGVNVPTVKFYLNQGLLPRPIKTGKTMAYYDETYVGRIRLIKKLQREKFLPLGVIKRIIDSGDSHEDEIEFGKAAFKADATMAGGSPVSEARIEKITGYSLEKICILESEGLISPTKSESGKLYDAYDLEIIGLFRNREKLGVPFEHSTMTLRAYRKYLEAAVKEDLKLFANSFLGELPTRQAVKFMTEADESIDRFLIISRRRIIRNEGFTALNRLNEISGELALLNFLPLEARELPPLSKISGRKAAGLRLIRSLFSGNFKEVINLQENGNGSINGAEFQSAGIISMLLLGDVDGALDAARSLAPEPSSRPLINSAAALACMFGLGKASGFSKPIYLAKRALEYLRKIEAFEDKVTPEFIISRYVCGTLYTMLPDFFDTIGKGTLILGSLAELLKSGKVGRIKGPDWLRHTIKYEAVPAMEIRVNRFLAEGLIKLGNPSGAAIALERIIKISDPASEFARWANMKRFEIGARVG